MEQPLQLRARQSTLPGDLLDIMSTRAKQFTAGTSITIRWEEAPALPTAAGALPAELLPISGELPEGRYDILATSAAELGAAAESGALHIGVREDNSRRGKSLNAQLGQWKHAKSALLVRGRAWTRLGAES